MDGPRFDVFLSHMSGDKPVVEALARLLKNRGIEPWLDKWNLIPGRPWQEAIEKALDACASCAVCLGPSGIGPWQNEEMRAAINRRVSRDRGRFHVIPVLLPGAKPHKQDGLPAFLTATTWVEFRDTIEDERALHRLICGIRGIEPGPDPGEAIAEGARPYRGLQPFDVDDARFFFGREDLIQELLGKLSSGRFLAVIGPSGSGKSSLARAGLLAALKRGEIPGSETWPAAVLKPGAQPLERLGERLGESRADALKLIQDLASDTKVLHLTTGFALRDAPADRRFVILVDQFEEVFTLCPEEATRRAFIDNLLYAARVADGKTVVLLTLRADFYGHCAAYTDLAKVLPNSQILVGPMRPEELRRAIERPSRLAGLEPESGLIDLLLGEVEDQPGSLPLLQHALLQIWERRQARRLTVAAYREIGGVAGALEQHAEEIFTGLTETEREACRCAFLRLVQVDEARGATRRRLARDALVSPADPEEERRATETVVDRLTDERLLTTEAAGEERRRTVEVAHEALLTAWKRLRDWIDADHEALRTRRRLDAAVGEWLDNRREPSYLYTGARLAQAEEWAGRRPGELSPEAREFLAASAARRDRQRRRAVILLAAAGVAAVLVATVMGRLWWQSQRQQRINLATQMAGQAKLNLASNPLVSLLLATEAARISGEYPDVKGALLAALARSDAQPLGSPGIAAIAASADRRSMVTVSHDRTATLWDLGAANPKALRTFRIEAPVEKLALSNDRRWLLLEDIDGLVRLRNLEEKTAPTVSPENRWPPGEPFSPDSRWLILQRWETSALYDLHGGPSTRELQEVPRLSAMAYSPDSRRLAVAFEEGGTVEVWDLPPGNRRRLPSSRAYVGDLAFSRNGLWLAAVIRKGAGENARVWRLDSSGNAGEPLLLDGCTGNSRVAMSPDGAQALTWGNPSGNTSCLWYLDSGARPVLEEFPAARAADFSVDGRWLAWAGRDGTVHLWTPSSLAIELPGQGGFVLDLFFAHGNGRLVTQAGIEAPRLWDLSHYGDILAATPNGARLAVRQPRGGVQLLESGKPARALETAEAAEAFGEDWTFSPDGSWLAAGREDRLLLWNLASGDLTPRVSRLPEPVWTLTFSPQNDWLAACGKAVVWLLDLQGRRAPRLLVRDPQNSFATALAFDSRATRLATGWEGGAVRIFQLNDPDMPLIEAPPARDATVTALAFSPDGKWLAITDNKDNARLWRPGQERPIENQDRQLRVLAFSEDSRQLAGGGEDGILQLWNIDEGVGVPLVWRGHDSVIRCLSFTKDGKELISTGENDAVRRWPLDPEEMVRRACEQAGRNLTREEWKTYAPPGEPFREGTPCGELPSRK
ncbi:MAG TPA: TIR domain-containing protein [Thermoanaerobaculia bacterium]